MIIPDPLCYFAGAFPNLVENILHRDRSKRRNFREETVTDLMMAGLSSFEPFGLFVDFPADESKTGEDMDWEFVDEHATDGQRYLRLHIQAKRAVFLNQKINNYWIYRELDHKSPKTADFGSQRETLVSQAINVPGCIPLYMFYHTKECVSQINNKANNNKIEGVNAIFADVVKSNLSSSRWPSSDKAVEMFVPYFFGLKSLLCWKRGPLVAISRRSIGPFAFVNGPTGLPKPAEVAQRLRSLRTAQGQDVEYQIKAVGDIPASTVNRIRGEKDQAVERPRAIFVNRQPYGLNPTT